MINPALLEVDELPKGGDRLFCRTRPIRVVHRSYHTWKRFFDVVVCLLLLPAAVTIMTVCAVLIWLESGRPVVFRQLRTGKCGKRFQMFKFRTMVTNAEVLKEELAHLNELTWPDFKISNDPRMTRIGRILRMTSLDEVPQLINVLRGEMSLVGPRPTSFDARSYELWQTERLEVMPGITGLWQISGRSDVDFEERSRLDVAYIEKQSLWLDLSILLRTLLVLLNRHGAY